jgi:hypothetical protein
MTWTPLTRDHYEIELIDSSLETVGHLNEAVKPTFELSCYGHGSGSLALHVGSSFAALLLTDEQWFVRVYRNGVYFRAYMFSSDDWGVSPDSIGDEYIEVVLSPLDMIASWDFCQPETASGTFAPPELPVDDAFRWIVEHTIGPSAYNSPAAANRSIAGLSVEADTSDGPATTIAVCNKLNLFEFLQKYGPTYDVDWEFVLEKTTGDQNEIIFRAHYGGRGLDKTAANGEREPVILNDASNNVPWARRYRRIGGMRNVAVAKGLNTERSDAPSVSAWGRRAILVNSKEADAMDVALDNQALQRGYELGFAPSEQCEFGAHFVVGDTVTFSHLHLGIAPVDEMVKSARVTFGDDGVERVELTLGSFEKTIIDDVRDAKGGTGGGGGGGGGIPGWIDPIKGLKDNAGTFVPFSADPDYQFVQLEAGANMTVTGNVAANSVTLASTGGETAAIVQAAEPAPTWVGQLWLKI